MKLKFALGSLLVAALAGGCVSSASDESPSNAGATSSAAGSTGNPASGAGNTLGGAPGSAGQGAGTAGNASPGGGSSSAGTGNLAGTGGVTPGGAGAGSGGMPGAGGAAPGTSPVKGVAFNLMGASCADLNTLGLSWYYAWSGTAPCPGTAFVPMVWGSWKKLDWVPTPQVAVSKGAKYLLGFNEPDLAGQSSMSVEEAIGLWADFQQPGVLLGSPAVAGQEEWLPQFMQQAAAKNLRVDFIALHWYGWFAKSCDSVTALENKIIWAEQWKRPIWITEWSCRLQSPAVTQKFFSDALVMLKKHPTVERYAWFLSRSTGEFADATLLDGTGKPTTLGGLYVAAPSTR